MKATYQMHVRLDEWMVEHIEDLSKKFNMSHTAIVNAALADYINKHKTMKS